MTKYKDPDQQAVYYAERVTFEDTLFEEPLHSDDFMALANRLFTHDWWERHSIPVPIIEPTTSRDSTSYAWIHNERVGKDPIIRIAPHDINARVLAHEAAHIAQHYFYKWDSYGPIEAHGREFRATYLSVAEIALGRGATSTLGANLTQFVKVRPEHAPGQPGSIMCVPRPRPEHGPIGLGLYPTWRLERQTAELNQLRQRLPAVSTPRISGAIAL